MPYVSDVKIDEVAEKLWREVYEHPFRGKDRGRFAVTRDQMRQALDVERLHESTIERLQERALEKGLVIINLDDLFPCIETKVLRKYRRPPKAIFDAIFGDPDADEDDVEDTEDTD